ncbi:hypothetical protein BDZ91DRAFT_765649 [Kalaharituber pfeilii]|nr:hypothetical protein BDZ91DRAFT_765649 [Kalaharituber pfeilii]
MRKNGLSGRAGGVEIEASCELIFSEAGLFEVVPGGKKRVGAALSWSGSLVWLASTPFRKKMAFLEWYGVFLELQKRASTANPTAPAKNEKAAPVRCWESSQRGQQADGLALHATELENAAVTSMRACTGDCDGVGVGFALFFFGFAAFLPELFCLLVSGRKVSTA